MDMTTIANLIPDATSRTAWVRAGMPTDLATVASIVTEARQAVVASRQASISIVNPFTRQVYSRPIVAA